MSERMERLRLKQESGKRLTARESADYEAYLESQKITKQVS